MARKHFEHVLHKTTMLMLSTYLFSTPAGANTLDPRKTLFYEPVDVRVSGTLEIQTFPGPPGYESIKNGDEIESCWYLRLDEPVDVDLKISNEQNINDEPEKRASLNIPRFFFGWGQKKRGCIFINFYLS